MSVPSVRTFAIALWVCATVTALTWAHQLNAAHWTTVLVLVTVPPAMLLWFWNKETPLVIGSLSRRETRR